MQISIDQMTTFINTMPLKVLQEKILQKPNLKNTAEITKAAIIEDRRELREGFPMQINFTDSFACAGAFCSMEEAHARL